jgi:hypothetical protein
LNKLLVSCSDLKSVFHLIVSWLRSLFEESREIQNLIVRHKLEYPAVSRVNRLLCLDSHTPINFYATPRGPKLSESSDDEDEAEEDYSADETAENHSELEESASSSDTSYSDEEVEGAHEEENRTGALIVSNALLLAGRRLVSSTPRFLSTERPGPLSAGTQEFDAISKSSTETTNKLKSIDASDLRETESWLDSNLFANGIFAAGVTTSTDKTTNDSSLLAQWTLLRQLTDAPNGAGDAHVLVHIMKKYVREDQGMLAGPNHAVHATCAALIWHEGLGAEALEIVAGNSRASSGQGKNVKPSSAFQHVWKLGQSMRLVYPNNADENDEIDSDGVAAPVTGSSISSLGNKEKSIGSSLAGDTDLEDAIVSPFLPIKLMKQYSLPVQDHGQGPLLPNTLAAVRRARLLLGYLPASLVQDIVTDSSSFSGPYFHRLSEASNKFNKRTRMIHAEHNSQESYRLKSGRVYSIVQNILKFIQYGPDADVFRKIAEYRKEEMLSRTRGLVDTKSILSNLSNDLHGVVTDDDVRYVADILFTLRSSIGSVSNPGVPPSMQPKTSKALGLADPLANDPAKRTHFLTNLGGGGKDANHRIITEWTQIVEVMSSIGMQCLSLLPTAANPGRKANLPTLATKQSLELATVSVAATIAVDFQEEDLVYVGSTVNFLKAATQSIHSFAVRKAGCILLELFVHLCSNALQSHLQNEIFFYNATKSAQLAVDNCQTVMVSQQLLREILSYLSDSFSHSVEDHVNVIVSANSSEMVRNDALFPITQVAKLFSGVIPCDPMEEGVAVQCKQLMRVERQRQGRQRALDRVRSIANHSFSFWLYVPADCSSGLIITRLMGTIAPLSFFSVRLIEHKLCVLIGDKSSIGTVDPIPTSGISGNNLISLSSDAVTNAMHGVNLKTFEGITVTSSDRIPKDCWVQVGFTFDTKDEVCYLYVDGSISQYTMLSQQLAAAPFPYPELFYEEINQDRHIDSTDAEIENDETSEHSSCQPFTVGQVPATFATVGRAAQCWVANLCISNRALSLIDYARLGCETCPSSFDVLSARAVNGSQQLIVTSDDSGILCSNPSTGLQAATAYIAIPEVREECAATVRVLRNSNKSVFSVGLVSTEATAVSSTSQLFDGSCDTFGVQISSGGISDVATYRSLSKGQDMAPDSARGEVLKSSISCTNEFQFSLVINMNTKTFSVACDGCDGESVGGNFAFNIADSMASKAAQTSGRSGSGKTSQSVNSGRKLFIGVTLQPGQQAKLLFDDIRSVKRGSNGLELEGGSSAISSQDLLEGDTCQAVANWDPELSDQQRLEISSFDTVVYFPAHTSLVSNSKFSGPAVAARITAPRSSITVMIGRNIPLQGFLSIGLARISRDAPKLGALGLPSLHSPDRYASLAGGSLSHISSAVAEAVAAATEADKLIKYVQQFFNTDSNFGTQANSWGIVDSRKGKKYTKIFAGPANKFVEQKTTMIRHKFAVVAVKG